MEALTRSLIVSVDFGTTFSTCAWSQTARPEIQTVIQQWPNEHNSIDGLTSDAVPTELRYQRGGKDYKWGYQIKESEPRIQRFKLDLNPNVGRQVSYLTLTYPDALSMPPDYSRKATDLTTDYLKKFHAHTMSILKSKLGEAVVSTTPIQYVLTVPAIWQDKAKDLTRACAKAAGFGDSIHMITEPEAAVTYALDAMDAGTLSVGDAFVLLDAGGGTADLISYTVEALGKVVKVKEAAGGTGDLCGSSFLNSIFRNFMIKRFGHEDDWDDDTLEDAMTRFEKFTKRDFHGEEGDFVIPVPGLPDSPSKSVKRGKLRLTLQEMLDIFEPVVSPMTVLVTNQIKATKTKVKAVLLVGGFGQSPYLERVIQKVVGPEVEVLQPANGWTAVARGALIRGLALASSPVARVSISSRIARKSFGIELAMPFDFKKHDATQKYWSAFDAIYRIRYIAWLVKKGDTLREDVPVLIHFTYQQLVTTGLPAVKENMIHVYDGINAENPPFGAGNGVRPHTNLASDLTAIPERQLPKEKGKDGKMYYDMDCQVKVYFFSAHTEYSLWYNNKCYGKVEAKYE